MSLESTASISQLCRTGVDLSGLMAVLSQHLYSTPAVAIRELIQNAHDAIVRRRIEQPDWQGSGRIEVHGDPAARQLRIVDVGAGLTEAEIHAELATIGTGRTRQLREAGSDAQALIGMFGLGFLSAFVIAERVTVRTTSYQTPTLRHVYSSTSALQYRVSPTGAGPVGTEVVLDLKPEFAGLADHGSLRQTLRHYCALLAIPIHLGAGTEPVNDPPPWRQAPDPPLHWIQRRRLELDFATRFARGDSPICTLPVTPREGSDAVGVLWVQDRRSYATSDRRQLSVYLRGMLLDDDARDLLPSWAGFVGGVIESTALTPTASREDLQRDAGYRAVQRALNECLIEGLAQIAREQREAWRRVLLRHNEALLGASLCDERLFDLLADQLTVPTLQGDRRLAELIRDGAVHLVHDSQPGFEAMWSRTLGTPVALGDRFGVQAFLRQCAERRRLTLVELGTDQGHRRLFEPATLTPAQSAWLAQHLAAGETLVAARFAPSRLPLVVVADRDHALKRRLAEDEQDRKISSTALLLARRFAAELDAPTAHRLYLNLDCPVVGDLLQAIDDRPEAALRGVRLLRSFKTLLSDADAAGAEALAEALTDVGTAVRQLLDLT